MDALVTLQRHSYNYRNDDNKGISADKRKNGKIYSQYRITIPKRIIDKLSWGATNNELLALSVHGDSLVCKLINNTESM